MTEFNITSPEGHQFKITAPEGVTEDEVLRRVQSQKLPPSDPSFASEVVRGFTEPVRGVAQLAEHVVPFGSSAESKVVEGEGTVKEPKVKQGTPQGETVGSAIGSMIGPAGAVGALGKIAPKALGPMARSVIGGGIGGAVQPVEGKDEDYWTNKTMQTGEGMAMGFGFTLGGKALSAGVDALGRKLARDYGDGVMSQAVAAVLNRIQQDSKHGAPTAEQALSLIEAANAGGKPFMLADVGGRNLRSLGGHVARSPGDSRQIVNNSLTSRDEQASQRLSADIARYVHGGPTMHQATEGLLTARSAAARPLYAETDALQGVWSPRLQQFLDNPDVKKGMARGYHIERLTSLAEGRPFDPTMLGVDLDAEGNIAILRKPNMRVLDMGKQGLDAMIADERGVDGRLSSMGVALSKARKAYVNELDSLDKSGVYKKARESWSGYSGSLDALKLGRQGLNPSVSPEENEAMIAGLTEGDREFARMGLADVMRERLGKAGFNSDESRALIRNDWTRKQMRPFFRSSEDFNKFVDAVASENTMAQTKNEMLRGSQTAERQAEDKSQENSVLHGSIRLVKAAVEMRVLSVASEMWRMHRDFSRKPDPQLNEAIAKLIFAPDIAQTDLGRRLLQEQVENNTNLFAPASKAIQQNVVPPVAAASGALLPRDQAPISATPVEGKREKHSMNGTSQDITNILAENDPLPIDPKEDEIKVPAHIPEKYREDWIKHRKQIQEYGKKSA